MSKSTGLEHFSVKAAPAPAAKPEKAKSSHVFLQLKLTKAQHRALRGMCLSEDNRTMVGASLEALHLLFQSRGLPFPDYSPPAGSDE